MGFSYGKLAIKICYYICWCVREAAAWRQRGLRWR